MFCLWIPSLACLLEIWTIRIDSVVLTGSDEEKRDASETERKSDMKKNHKNFAKFYASISFVFGCVLKCPSYMNLNQKSEWKRESNVAYLGEWEMILSNQLSITCNNFADKLGWQCNAVYQSLSTVIKDSNKSKEVRRYEVLTEALDDVFVKTFDDQDWLTVCRHRQLTENFIELYRGNIRWLSLSCNWYSCFSLAFYARNAEFLNFAFVSKYHQLSECVMEYLIEDLEWETVSQYQHLSEDFIIKYHDRIDHQALCKNRFIVARCLVGEMCWNVGTISDAKNSYFSRDIANEIVTFVWLC